MDPINYEVSIVIFRRNDIVLGPSHRDRVATESQTNPMTIGPRNWILITMAAVLTVGGIALLITRRALAPTPNLSQVQALARAGQFNHAQKLLDHYLHAHPENERAHLLMAQLTTEANNSQPDIALEQLAAIQSMTPKQTAKIKFLEGKAHYQQGHYDLAEDSWTEALRLDPTVPEAGWVLIDLLDKEGRQQEAHRLGMQLHEIEPDPRDRVKILLEMSRLDIETPDPVSQVPLFEPLVKQHPENLPLAITLGLALIRVNRGDEGIEVLQEAVRRHPDSVKAWDAWLTGLFQASEAERLAQEFARLPRELVALPQFAKHEGTIAQIAKNWQTAAKAFGRAFAFEPYNWGVCYRLLFVLRQAGDTVEYDRIHRVYETYKTAYKEMRGSFYERFEPGETVNFPAHDFTQQRGAYYETLAIKTLGMEPHPKLYQRLANLREKMGRFDEAKAWHRLVLRDFPDDAVSLAALERLK
jgi:tetratricopeptide (TPR) repeat protein